jgi:glycosyltransferase involved in cell wall biosynthesis
LKFQEEPLVSVVIPTHNREQYAFDSILSLLRFNNKKIEVVVSDTSTNNILKRKINSLNLDQFATKLNYFKPDTPLDITGNHNSAVAAARGKFICVIGDDDTVTSELIDVAEWADSNNIACLAPTIKSNYAWPDFKTVAFGNSHAGRLYLPRNIEGLNKVEGFNSLLAGLSNAAQGTEGMAKLYHGLVRRDILDDLKRISGSYFHGSSPDVSASIGISFILARRDDYFYSIGYPLTIPGASGGSNTGRSAMNSHVGALGSERQTCKFAEDGWPIFLPKFFSVQTVWAHACISTLKAMGATELLEKFNYQLLFAACLNSHSNFSKQINDAINQYALEQGLEIDTLRRNIYRVRVKLKVERFKYISRRLLWPTASGGRPFVSGIASISETQSILRTWLQKKGFTLHKIIFGID